jgi:hypothetical protein
MLVAAFIISLSCMTKADTQMADTQMENIQMELNVNTTTGEMSSSTSIPNNRRLLQDEPRILIDNDKGGEDRFVQSSRRGVHKSELIAFTGRYYHTKSSKTVDHKRRYSPGRSLLQSHEDLYQDPEADSVSEEEETLYDVGIRDIEKTEIVPEEMRYVVTYEDEDSDVTDRDVNIYEDFIRIPTVTADNIEDIDDFTADTGYDIIMRRRRLLDSYSVDPIGRPSRTLNGIGDVGIGYVAPLINVPHNPSEVMNYVGVILASLSSLAGILGLCYKRRGVTYITNNHHTLVDPSKTPVSEILHQPQGNPRIPKLNNNIEQTQPLIPMNELLTEMNAKTILNVDSFLRYV